MEGAAEGAAEYCLFWIDVWWLCLTKNEWASWVQALGTLLTLAVAGWVAWYEVRQRRLDANRSSAMRLTAQIHLIDLAMNDILVYSGECRRPSVSPENHVAPAHKRLTDAITRVQEIEIVMLPTKESMFHMSEAQALLTYASQVLPAASTTLPSATTLAKLQGYHDRVASEREGLWAERQLLSK